MKRKKVIIIIIIAVIAIGCVFFFYQNQQTVPSSFIDKSYETFTPDQADSTNINKLGIHLYLTFSKNKSQLLGSDPMIGNDPTVKRYNKQMNPNSKTAKAIYKAFGHEKYKATDYTKIEVADLGRTHIEKHKNSWTLKSKKLTLTFSKDTDGNWRTPDGTIWLAKKNKK